jgi:putative endonuclease
MEERYPWIAVYILSDHYRGTLYIGVTSDLISRVIKHPEGVFDGFTKHYGLHRLVWYETFGSMTEAIQREKTLKHWVRDWKINLIERDNPCWNDLFDPIASTGRRFRARCDLLRRGPRGPRNKSTAVRFGGC